MALTAEIAAEQAQFAHGLLAIITRFPGWEIDDIEANKLGISFVNLMKEMQWRPAPKTLAFSAFVTAIGMIDGPRFYQFAKSKRDARKHQKQNAQAEQPNVVMPAFN